MLVLLAIEGVTVVFLRPLLSMHVFVLRLPGLVGADRRCSGHENGGYLRSGLLAFSLVAGLTLALFTVQYASPWLHWAQLAGG